MNKDENVPSQDLKYLIYITAKSKLEDREQSMMETDIMIAISGKTMDNFTRGEISHRVICALHDLCKLYTLDQTPHEFDEEIIKRFIAYHSRPESREMMYKIFGDTDEVWSSMKSVSNIETVKDKTLF